MKIGVLALQGGFIEHINMLGRLGVTAVPVYNPGDLEDKDGLILPGGESTAILNLMHSSNIYKSIREKAQAGLPVMGTCAGMVLMAKKVLNSNMETLALIDIAVKRNAFGRQVDSFEAEIGLSPLDGKTFPAIFIRAPVVDSTGTEVEVLGRLKDGTVVAVRQGNLVALSFHPELSQDTRLHRYFLEIVKGCPR